MYIYMNMFEWLGEWVGRGWLGGWVHGVALIKSTASSDRHLTIQFGDDMFFVFSVYFPLTL